MMIALYIVLGIFVLSFYLLYAAWCRSSAAALLLLMLAESIAVPNMPGELRPDFIINRSLVNIDAIKPLARPLAKWYIKNHGLELVEPAVALIKEDLEEQGFVRD